MCWPAAPVATRPPNWPNPSTSADVKQKSKTRYGSFASKTPASTTKEVVPVEEFVPSEALTPPKPPDGGWGWVVVFGMGSYWIQLSDSGCELIDITSTYISSRGFHDQFACWRNKQCICSSTSILRRNIFVEREWGRKVTNKHEASDSIQRWDLKERMLTARSLCSSGVLDKWNDGI